MILRYGNYTHDDNEVWHHIQARDQVSQTGEKIARHVRWTINGILHPADTTHAIVTSEVQALENAYKEHEKDLRFFASDGSTISAHSISNDETINGVRVESFEWLPGGHGGILGSGSEYVTKRSYRIVITAEIPAVPGSNHIVHWEESLQRIGTGGADFVSQTAIVGPVQQQFTKIATPTYAVQRGYAVGYIDYPQVPSALFPTTPPLKPNVRITPGTPKRFNKNQNTHFPVSWEYRYESTSPLTGTPILLG